MTRKAGISGILFLCMYCLILLHNTVPHHHCADALDGPAQSSHHHDDHHHPGHAHGTDSESTDVLGLLLDFLGGLDHQDNLDGDFAWFFGEDARLQLKAVDLSQLFAVLSPRVLVPALGACISHACDLPPPAPRSLRTAAPAPLRGPPSFS